MLHASAPRAWDAAELAQELRIDSAWAASRAELLCERGLIHCEADPVRRYSYHPASSQLDQEVKDLAAVYADQRVSIISFIYSRPPDQLRLFSDAFRLRKEQNDE